MTYVRWDRSRIQSWHLPRLRSKSAFKNRVLAHKHIRFHWRYLIQWIDNHTFGGKHMRKRFVLFEQVWTEFKEGIQTHIGELLKINGHWFASSWGQLCGPIDKHFDLRLAISWRREHFWFLTFLLGRESSKRDAVFFDELGLLFYKEVEAAFLRGDLMASESFGNLGFLSLDPCWHLRDQFSWVGSFDVVSGIYREVSSLFVSCGKLLVDQIQFMLFYFILLLLIFNLLKFTCQRMKILIAKRKELRLNSFL